MAIRLFNCDDVDKQGVFTLIHGPTGSGKTTSLGTVADLTSAFLISAEGGALSLKGSGLAGCEVNNMAEIQEALHWLIGSEEARGINCVALDSLSEIADFCLAEELEQNKDGRKAYGAMATRMQGVVKSFRDYLPGRDVIMTSRHALIQDDAGRLHYGPDLPGKQLDTKLPYWFDAVLALQVGKGEDESIRRVFQTFNCGSYLASVRLPYNKPALPPFMEPNLAKLFRAILD